MAQRLVRIPVRHGHTVAHVASITEAAELMLCLQRAAPRDCEADLPRDVIGNTCTASNAALSSLVKSFPLQGKVRKNLGTVLRVKCVRANLATISTPAGDSLLTELQYISNAADAVRHLTATSIECAIATIQKLDPEPSQVTEEPSTDENATVLHLSDATSTTFIASSDDGVCSVVGDCSVVCDSINAIVYGGALKQDGASVHVDASVHVNATVPSGALKQVDGSVHGGALAQDDASVHVDAKLCNGALPAVPDGLFGKPHDKASIKPTVFDNSDGFMAHSFSHSGNCVQLHRVVAGPLTRNSSASTGGLPKAASSKEKLDDPESGRAILARTMEKLKNLQQSMNDD